jgi:phospholipase C
MTTGCQALDGPRPPSGDTAPGQPTAGTRYPRALSAGTFNGAQPPTPRAGAQRYGGTDHSWATQHRAWHGGLMNAWQHAKGGHARLPGSGQRDHFA